MTSEVQVGHEEQLTAFLDGELDLLRQKWVEDLLREDEAARAFVEQERNVRAALRARFDPILDEPVPERLRALLGGDVVPFPAPKSAPSGYRARFYWPVAASFAVGVLAAQLLPAGLGQVSDSRTYAEGQVAQALETQLASSQGTDAVTRVGVTFASHDGRICRTYENQADAGLACRSNGGWEVLATARVDELDGEYRQAATGSAFVMGYAQELMAGAAFDAHQERSAFERRWSVEAQ